MAPEAPTYSHDAAHLACSLCGCARPLGSVGLCPRCGGILHCAYPRAALECLRELSGRGGLERYCPLLPTEGHLPSLGEGNTPLLRARALERALGLEELYLKNETLNPTGSFKDRGAVVAVARALAEAKPGVITASTGNAAASLAAYCASQGLACLVLSGAGSPPSKLGQALMYGGRCIRVEGLFDVEPQELSSLLVGLSGRLGMYLAFFWAPINPHLLEGMKTIAYETVAQLGGCAPDVVVCPVGGGDGLVGQWRGYQELLQAGVIQQLPRMVGVQSTGAAPLVRSFEGGFDRVAHIEHAQTVASGLQVSFSGDHALRAVRASGGAALAVEDADIISYQSLLARSEGLWAEPSGVISVAALPRLLSRGLIPAHERVVCVITGAGFKDRHHDGIVLGRVDAEVPRTEFNLAEIEAAARYVIADHHEELGS